MKQIHRYDSFNVVATPFNPIDDILCWISGLRSEGYNADILRYKHNMCNGKSIQESAKLISVYSGNALELIEQAYSGPPDVSFLPLYYAILNLSKIYIVLKGKSNLLREAKNRYHGATYDIAKKPTKDILNETITINQNGVLPLFYKSITNKELSGIDSPVKLSDIYPYILNIEYEFRHIYQKPKPFIGCEITINGDLKNGYSLIAKFGESKIPNIYNAKYLNIITNLQQDENDIKVFKSSLIKEEKEEKAIDVLLNTIKRYLLYDAGYDELVGKLMTYTVISKKDIVFPEELPKWIAFFHLSNIVRYYPETLLKIRDSKAWPILLSLRTHGVLRFLILLWSFINQKTVIIKSK